MTKLSQKAIKQPECCECIKNRVINTEKKNLSLEVSLIIYSILHTLSSSQKQKSPWKSCKMSYLSGIDVVNFSSGSTCDSNKPTRVHLARVLHTQYQIQLTVSLTEMWDQCPAIFATKTTTLVSTCQTKGMKHSETLYLSLKHSTVHWDSKRTQSQIQLQISKKLFILLPWYFRQS